MTPTPLIPATFAWLCTSLFVILYGRVHWWRSAEGRNVMSLAVIVGCLALIGVVRGLLGDRFADLLAVGAWTAVGVIFLWRSSLLLRAQGFRRDPD